MSDYDQRIVRETHIKVDGTKLDPGLGSQQERSNTIYNGPTEVAGSAERAELQKGVKYDEGKSPLALLSSEWLLAVGSVMGFGAKKYAAHNWRNGIACSRLMSSALRHVVAFNSGEDVDSETGLSHLAHASCCLMFAFELQKTHPDLDDRYKQKKI